MNDTDEPLKRICIGFFGFIRNPLNMIDFNRFRDLLPNKYILDVIISCPNKINEYDTDVITLETMNQLSAFNECNVYIDLYDYDPIVFIKRVRDIGLPDYTTFPSYRVCSQHFSISRLCKNILKYSQENHIEYDHIILTRMDILPGVKSLGNLLEQRHEHIIHIWRRYPYVSNSDAEDRIIISSIQGIHALCGLYDSGLRHCCLYTPIVPEIILGKYLSLFNNLVLLPQDGIILEHSPSISVKYSDRAKHYLEELLKTIT
jgi:hypothetical protein